MRVLFLTPSVRMLGARQSLHALTTHLPPDVEPLVVCSGSGGLTQELQASNIPVEVVSHGAWRKLGGRAHAILRQLPALRRISRRFLPHVIHCNEFHSTPQGVATARGTGGEVGISTHIRLGIRPDQISKYSLPRCHRIVAVSEACRGLLAGSVVEDRTRVVYNGVDLSAFEPAERDLTVRNECGWGADELVVGLLGLISPRKNQLVAAEAVALANKRGIPARLLLAGDAFKSTESYGEELRRRLEQPDLAQAAKWLPFQKEVRPVYEALDVNLLVSAEEGFGRTICESAALGIPSIGARTGGIPELIREGETGWLVDEGDVESLAGAFQTAWEARSRLADIGWAAREHAVANFSIEAHVRGMIAVWEEAREAAAR
ncbi:glycosyltransferase family 4 protein [bacterium]|nr:glycosyltransferase family 4 protein [bacterium]